MESTELDEKIGLFFRVKKALLFWDFQELVFLTFVKPFKDFGFPLSTNGGLGEVIRIFLVEQGIIQPDLGFLGVVDRDPVNRTFTFRLFRKNHFLVLGHRYNAVRGISPVSGYLTTSVHLMMYG